MPAAGNSNRPQVLSTVDALLLHAVLESWFPPVKPKLTIHPFSETRAPRISALVFITCLLQSPLSGLVSLRLGPAEWPMPES